MSKKKQCEYFHATNLYDCPSCGIKLRDFNKELRVKVDAVPKETKQKFVDFLKEGNVGSAIKKIDPNGETDSLIWFTIVSDQIRSMEYFDTVVR